ALDASRDGHGGFIRPSKMLIHQIKRASVVIFPLDIFSPGPQSRRHFFWDVEGAIMGKNPPAFAKSPTRHSRFGDGAASAGARRSFSGGGPPYERLCMRRANELMARQFQRVRRPAHMADQNFSFHLSCCAKNMLAVA